MKHIQTPHFSKKVFAMSLAFILVNVAIFGLKDTSSKQGDFTKVTSVLNFEAGESVEYMALYGVEFEAAEAGQALYSGSTIKTNLESQAEFKLGENTVKLDENTIVKIIDNSYNYPPKFQSDKPRLSLKLLQGGLWVNAYDHIEVSTPQVTTSLNHAVGVVTYSKPLNRIMALTGDIDLSLKNAEGKALSEFVLPLHNQVTFADFQLTDVYAAIKPSKLKKELKMTAISSDVLADEWLIANVNDFMKRKTAFKDELVESKLEYELKNSIHSLLSIFSFNPESKRDLALTRVDLKLNYLMGKLDEDRDTEEATVIIDSLDGIVRRQVGNLQISDLLTQTIFVIENVDFRGPRSMLRDYLIETLQVEKGQNLFRIYLTDLRKYLYLNSVNEAESSLKKWEKSWEQGLIAENLEEYTRQTQILNHTLASNIGVVTLEMLDTFDKTGDNRIMLGDDLEEIRYEVTQERLRMGSNLVASYNYSLAKQYLKNSYLGLNIEDEDQNSPSVNIFLEKGRLLAQRIEYAQAVLYGSAQKIDETKFREYFQARTRDGLLSDDLRVFFEIEKDRSTEVIPIQAPERSEIVSRFLEDRVSVSYVDVELIDSITLRYSIKNARLLDRGSEGELISFDATYDYITGSVSEVITSERTYKGGFILEDIIRLLLSSDQLVGTPYSPQIIEGGIDLLITDQEKIEAKNGQVLAQDLAIKLAVTRLAEAGVVVTDVRGNIEILDAVNLDKFRVSGALISRLTEEGAIQIDFNFYSTISTVTDVRTAEGVLLIQEVLMEEMAEMVLKKALELEKEIETIADFIIFARQNELAINDEDIIYTAEGFLILNDLEIETLGLTVKGLYDSESGDFLTVTNNLLSSQNIKLRTYFEALANVYLINIMSGFDIQITSPQIEATYPFRSIVMEEVSLSGYNFDFTFDLAALMLRDITRFESVSEIEDMTIEGLRLYAQQLRQQADLVEPPAQNVVNGISEESDGPLLPSSN